MEEVRARGKGNGGILTYRKRVSREAGKSAGSLLSKGCRGRHESKTKGEAEFRKKIGILQPEGKGKEDRPRFLERERKVKAGSSSSA